MIEDNTFNNLPSLHTLLMKNNPISFVSEKAFDNVPKLTSLSFDMYCGRCHTIPFWRWLKLSQKFSYSIACYDYDGEALSNLQANNFTNCFACVDGMYGQNCAQNCSDNCYNNTCHVVSGLCVYGCRKGWMGPSCQQLTPKSADNYIAVYIGVAAFVVTALVAVIVVATLRYRKKKRQQRRQIVREFDSVTYTGDRNTEQHYPEAHIVDSSMEDLEQYDAESDIVDSSTVELEQVDE